jgi:L-asparagine transporter-like permease
MGPGRKQAAFSLGTAAASCFLPYLFPPGIWDLIIRISLWLALFWFACLVVAVVRYKKKGLWFRVGFPFVLYWPFVLFLIGWGCQREVRNCP